MINPHDVGPEKAEPAPMAVIWAYGIISVVALFNASGWAIEEMDGRIRVFFFVATILCEVAAAVAFQAVWSSKRPAWRRRLAALYVIGLCAINAFSLVHSATLTNRVLRRQETAAFEATYQRERQRIEDERKALDHELASIRPDPDIDLGPRERAEANALYEREVARANLRRSALTHRLGELKSPRSPALPWWAFFLAVIGQLVLMAAPWALGNIEIDRVSASGGDSRRGLLGLAAWTGAALTDPRMSAPATPAAQDEPPARVPADAPGVACPRASRVTRAPGATRNRHGKVTEEIMQRMLALRREKRSLREIAREVGLSRQTVWRHVGGAQAGPDDARV